MSTGVEAGGPTSGSVDVTVATHEHVSASARAAHSLRNMILTGQLRCGQLLVHDDLARRLNVSTMPIREALLHLAHEGFAVVRPNRSVVVAMTSRHDIEDLFWLYGVVAEEVVRRACSKAGPDIADALDALNAQWHDLSQADAADYHRINFAFKQVITEAAGSTRLTLTLGLARMFIPDDFYSARPAWRNIWAAEHEKVAAAMRRSDEQGAATATRKYIQEASDILIRYFRDSGYWGPLVDEPPVA